MDTHKTSLIILLLIFIFAVIHSGGAALRIKAESIMGARLWRLCFVSLSLPSAIILISYFFAHTLWIGTSFTLVTSIGLVLHHLFAIWHGDKRLANRFGEEFENFKKSTSIIPFLAIIEGRQEFKIKEFFRLSQFGILIAIGVLWWSHQYINIAVTTFNSSFLSKFFN